MFSSFANPATYEAVTRISFFFKKKKIVFGIRFVHRTRYGFLCLLHACTKKKIIIFFNPSPSFYYFFFFGIFNAARARALVRSFAGRLPKWFGERPGKKKDDPETPEEEELKKNEEDEEPFGLDDEEAEEEVR